MYSFCDERLPPDRCRDEWLPSVLLRVRAIWRGEANTLAFKCSLKGIFTHRQSNGRWVFRFVGAIFEEEKKGAR
jgi:hypothetical protein